ncbi:glycosyltransferase family 2 protein, partial [Candidatus Dependentiae bacterium]|nr:glycosyltransferase family 2 protein [Candidatus Dependentiae bacterium]
IIIINDGSTQSFNDIFEKIKNLNINLIIHEKNMGKGQALKSGIKFCLNNFQNLSGIITADADGQHSVNDITKLANQTNLNKLILGKRYFRTKSVPLRSMLGNFLSRFAISFVSKQKIYDTQTGLRFIPTEKLESFVNIPGDRYEYETNMLLYAKKFNLKISEIPIETIYIENNKNSHFKPIKDAYFIYKSIFNFYLNNNHEK